MRRALACAVAGLLLLGASACTSEDPNSIAAQAKAGDEKGYISGDGTVERLPADRRGTPVDLKGTTLDGSAWDSADVRGKVVLVNLWGSWCAPCVEETPALQRAWESYESGGKVAFVGITFRDEPANARAFTEKYKVTYPSLVDESGALVLALQGKANSAPTTLVLDTEGRIAARASGAVTEATVKGLVDDVLSGKA